MNPFQLSRNTTLLSDAVTEKAVEFACERFRRDMEKTLTDIVKNRNRIILCKKDLKPEQYELEVTEQEITIYGADARSFIYALITLVKPTLECCHSGSGMIRRWK